MEITYLIIGVVTFLNLIILKIKLERERYSDLAVDVAGLVVLNYFFSGSLGGMTIAMVSSLLLSLYLLAFPPKMPNF